MAQEINFVDEKNLWHTETPGHAGWEWAARPGDPKKYLMISADCHCNEPGNLWWARIDKKFQHRLPHIEVDEKGEKWIIAEGYQKSRLRARNIAVAPKAARTGCAPPKRLFFNLSRSAKFTYTLLDFR